MKNRGSGILLHITSLPAPFGIGDLGPWAYRFVDFLKENRQRYWQILPLNPTSLALGNSPYSSFSAFAGNPLLISPELLAEQGFLLRSELEDIPLFREEKVDFALASEYKTKVLIRAYHRHKSDKIDVEAFDRFCRENAHWLDDYALYVVLKEQFGGTVWNSWPEDLRDRKDLALREWPEKLEEQITREKFFQHIFFKQWFSLKAYCNSQNIQIIGDLPIYVSFDSADVWTNSEIFKLDREKRPSLVAGVPPDYFSSTGQLWGNPVYNWEILKNSGYAWWIKRLEHNLKLFDIIRLDHFRGFVAYWEVPADHRTAIQGQWVEAPAKDFFNSLIRHFNILPIIAEDLGYITPDVREIMNLFGFPGMKILLFASGPDLAANPYVPHNYTTNCVVFTGTHDNNTIQGWFRTEAGAEDKKRLFQYIGREIGEKDIHWELIRLAMMSVADIVIIPIQDVLGLGEEARMNIPATSTGNWEWRLKGEYLTSGSMEKLVEMVEIYGR